MFSGRVVFFVPACGFCFLSSLSSRCGVLREGVGGLWEIVSPLEDFYFLFSFFGKKIMKQEGHRLVVGLGLEAFPPALLNRSQNSPGRRDEVVVAIYPAVFGGFTVFGE